MVAPTIGCLPASAAPFSAGPEALALIAIVPELAIAGFAWAAAATATAPEAGADAGAV